jgi:transposase
MNKYSEQFKLTVINKYLGGPLGFKAVADEVGVGMALVKRWVAFYRAHGVDGIKAKPYVRYSAEFKLKVLRHMWENHLSCAQAAAAFDVRGQCYVASWQRSYWTGGVDALLSASEKMPTKLPDPSITPPVSPTAPADADNRSREQLLDKIQYLEMEVAYLKKLRALIQSQQKTTPKKRKS